MSEQPGSDLIEAVQRGDSQRFEALVAPYLPKLRRELYAVTRDATEVDDLLQDTLLRAWRALPTYQDDGKFEAWLRTIARNVGLNEVRRRIARNISQTDSLEDTDPPRATGTPEDQAAAQQRLARIERLFDELPAEQKEVFVLHLLSGMSFKDIAEQQQVSINTALGRMYRVREKLRRLMSAAFGWAPARWRPWLAGVTVLGAVAAGLLLRPDATPTVPVAGGLSPAPDLAAAPAVTPADPAPWWNGFDFASVGAIGYWPQDFDPYDQTGTWPDGEWTAGERVPGRFGAAWRVRPGRFYEVAIPPRLQRLDEYTTAAWIWSDPGYFDDSGQVIGIGQDPQLAGALMMTVGTPGRAIVACGASAQSGSLPTSFLDPAPDWFGVWHHLACTYDRERGLQLYLDGDAVLPPPLNADGSPNASAPGWGGSIELSNARAPLRFNKSGWDNEFLTGEASRLSGMLDELMLFDRALSAEEVAALATDADGNGRADFWDAALARQSAPEPESPRE